MDVKKNKSGPKERAAMASDLDQDISYSLWRRGAGQRLADPVRHPGSLLR